MRIRETVYLCKKGNEYLVALVGREGETDVTKAERRFSVYRYDAAQLPRASIAQQVIRALRKDGDAPWSIIRYNKLTFSQQVIAAEEWT